MDCITISDDTSPASSRSAPDLASLKTNRIPSALSIPITINSESTQRCPVTWRSGEKRKCTVAPQFVSSNVTPMVKKRVNQWLASTMQLQQSSACSPNINFDNLDSKSSSGAVDDYFSKAPCLEESPKRNILIRHDFSKDEIVSNMCSYKQKWRYNNDDMLNGHHNEKECDNSSNIENETISIENKKEKQKLNNNEEPLSPESQKKNELCSYLQLMNMNTADKKMANKIQNRRSTRVKNLIIMSEKKELERRLNIEAMEKEKETEAMEKEKETEAMEKEKETEKNSALMLSADDKKKTLPLKSFAELSMHVEKENQEKSSVKSSSQPKLFSTIKIPRKILEIHSDFEDTIKSFITVEEKESTKEIFKDSQENKNEKCIKKIDKHVNGSLKKSHSSDVDLISLRSRSASVQLKSSPNIHRKKLRPHSLKSSVRHASSKQNSTIMKKTYRKILVRHRGRENLRSKISLSKVGIKTLILEDKMIKKNVQKEPFNRSLSKINIKNQRNLSDRNSNKRTAPNSSKSAKNKQRIKFVAKKQTKTNKEDSGESKEIVNHELKSVSNVSSVKPKPVKQKLEEETGGNKKEMIIEKVLDSKQTVKKLQEILGPYSLTKEAVETKDKVVERKDKVVERKDKVVERKDKVIETKDVTKRKGIEKRKVAENAKDIVKTNELFTNSFKEKAFSVIDLSHSKPLLNADILNDHSYTLKSHADKGYIMNVTLGTNEKSPVMESVVDNKLVNNDNYCKSPEILSGYKDGEYCKEMLEEIIGIPWRHFHRQGNKNKEENHADKFKNDSIKKSKETTESQTDIPMQFEYNSYQDSLLLNSNSPNKMFNIRLPLLEPPTNIFDEGPCSSPHIEHTDVTLQPSSEELSTTDDLDGRRPRITTMTVPPEIKSLHKSLMHSKRKTQLKNPDLYGESSNHTWDNDSSCEEKRSHSIKISSNNGNVMNAFYVDFNLVIVQEQLVSFWSQSALGNMLGSQDLWISKGSVQRLLLDSNCAYKESSDMVISLDNSFAYVELWTKEHKSDKRERPLADVFATVYFWRQRQNVPDKKVLQLENINGKGNDVQYIVLRNSRNIVVSWVEIRDDMKKTVVHCYCLAPDYQTVVDVREMDTVDHYVKSLHNIEDCDNMVMGFGEQSITLWNLEYGYVVSTIEIKSLSINPQCVWIKCDRGFLFILQYHKVERLLVLIAVNGISHSWKRLQVFRAPYGYDSLRGVCIDNNVLAAFYQRGVICWNIQTGESVIEEMSSQISYLPCDKHVIMLNLDKVAVQQFLSYFITSFDLQ